ncbi:MAG: hypothetical protein OXC05_11710 [Halieaceae bacterium]|nr:hypothetical protein [Halieaceae bacterium]
MKLSEEMTKAINRLCKWKLTNVAVLDKPVLILFDYSPTSDTPPLCIAFDSSHRAKCWLTETRLREIEDKCPKPHPKYKAFTFEGRKFHPFSIEAFPEAMFGSIDDFSLACRSLYDHVKWD